MARLKQPHRPPVRRIGNLEVLVTLQETRNSGGIDLVRARDAQHPAHSHNGFSADAARLGALGICDFWFNSHKVSF
jgi:hypothetical protein